VLFTSGDVLPEVGDYQIDVSGSANIKNARFSFAETGVYVGGSADLVLDNSVFENNRKGIEVRYGSVVNITGGIFSNNEVGVLYSYPLFQVKRPSKSFMAYLFPSVHADTSPAPTFSISQSSFKSNTQFAIKNWEFFGDEVTIDARDNYWNSPAGPIHSSNPSGMGDTVSDDVVFAPWLTEEPVVAEDKLDPVIIVPGILGSFLKDGEWVLDPILHTYDNLVDTFLANGYEKNKTLFTFPYDWRNSNAYTGDLLNQKIDEIKVICACTQVDVIAHSMGGLVTRSYAQSGLYDGDIDQIVFLGTPHKGAPLVYPMWEAGKSSNDTSDKITRLYLQYLAAKEGYLDLRRYIKERVFSLEQLLPIYSYIQNDLGILKIYPLEYPRNIFLENLDLSKERLGVFNIKNFFSANLYSTINFIIVASTTEEWEHGKPLNFDLSEDWAKFGGGDGAVPIESSYLGIGQGVTSTASHRLLPNSEKANVFNFLNLKDPEIVVNTSLPVRWILSFVFSPVDVMLVSPDGKRIGTDPITGEVLNEIPGAFYSGSASDMEYFAVPDPQDGEYKVISKGTGSGGEYKISTTYIDDLKSASGDIIGTAVSGIVEDHKLILEKDSTDPIQTEEPDILPPVISIISPEPRDYTRLENILIQATSTDLGSGVETLQAFLNDVEMLNGTTTSLLFSSLGTSTVSVISKDRAGNQASTTLAFRVISTPDSLIGAIKKFGVMGLIYKTQTVDWLVQRIEKMIVLEKKIKEVEEKIGNKNIKKKIERIEKRINKVLARLLIGELKHFKNGRMDERVYEVIRQDLEWFINN
jgi:pimeloyl-ACP methyl ester carboxylesterase